MEPGLETILGVCIGIGLAAACGFRVFVPLLVAAIAAKAGHLELSSSFDWIGSTPAIVCFAVATALEIGGYYIPWVDNLLDTIAAPAAVIAGTLLAASVMGDNVNPWLQWSLAIIAGGGAAGIVQGLTMLTRAGSTATTGGVANPAVSTAEMGGSLVLASAAIVIPIVTAIFVILLLVLIVRKLVLFLRRRRELARASAAGPSPA